MIPWAGPRLRAHSPNGITIGSAVFAQVTAECPYTFQWAPFPQNCPFPWGIWDRPLTRDSLGSSEPITQTVSRSVHDSFLKRSGMARVNEGSHSFTCHPHVYPQVEWTIHAFTPQPQSMTALWLVLISRPTEGKRLSWPRWLGEILQWGGLSAEDGHPSQYQPFGHSARTLQTDRTTDR